MANLTTQIEAALEKGRIANSMEPRATAAQFDPSRNRIIVVLANGASFEFPPFLAQGLAGATSEQLKEIEILGNGRALHWEALDADFSVPNLLNGVFGTSKWMASRAGSNKTARKAAAARENGAKGGRPTQAEVQSRSAAISEIVGRAPLRRKDIVSSVWEHIRKNNLTNPQNKREILADDKLRAVFGKDRLSVQEIGRKLAKIREDGVNDKSANAKIGKTSRAKIAGKVSPRAFGPTKKSA